MAEIQRISYDPAGESLFLAFESNKIPLCGVTENDSEYEVFADREQLEKGITKIVAVEILDMDGFDPEKANEIPAEFRQAIAEAYYKYRPEKRKTA